MSPIFTQETHGSDLSRLGNKKEMPLVVAVAADKQGVGPRPRVLAAGGHVYFVLLDLFALASL